ncbi:GNAT family N-acetyltransferase [Microbacterium gorillae]|uniref:GNAT family N-acetyltransferase n=1 Tax=Microbacterium gorillae TaxID=1231063 RepID=UPI00058AE9DA|nr:GNAT family N-acetyltransferase [Microbacterium gorillae]
MWHIRLDDLSGAPTRALVAEHLTAMRTQSPAESVHALDVDGLRSPTVRLYTAWDRDVLGGMAALQRIAPGRAEIKAMRTVESARGTGLGRLLLRHLVTVARQGGFSSLWLETGSGAEFRPARTLYASEGFEVCPPFGAYVRDPESVFMTRAI